MKKQVFLGVIAAVTVFFTTPTWAGFFDPFVHPTPPYGTDKACSPKHGLCRNLMVYEEGAAPNENLRNNYFYDNPNKDMTIVQKRTQSHKPSRPTRRRR